MPVRRRSAHLGTVVAGLLLAAGCGASSEPEPLQALEPVAPADLCATLPESTRAGLIANANTDETGNPTAACSLRSASGAAAQVQAVVTWMQASDEVSADSVWESQCQAINRAEFRDVAGFAPQGADEACAATGSAGGSDSTTIAAVSGLEVVTVRLTAEAGSGGPVLARGQQMLEGVLEALGTGS